MPLDEYRRKRDFQKTPEPSGDEQAVRRPARGAGPFFCVQKHLRITHGHMGSSRA
jgi:hypothetical protein